MPKIKRIAILLSGLFLFSCAGVVCPPSGYDKLKSYKLNLSSMSNVGSTMISNKDAQYWYQYVGYVKSPSGCEKYYTDDSFQEELIYTGRSGNTIHLSYREYKSDFARPAFFQELRYDIEQSDTIVFKQYRIKILEATNQFIRFIVLLDH